jgi:hypothetical protein
MGNLSLLLSSFGGIFSSLGVFLLYFLNNTDGNCLFHVSNGESSEWWILIEGFNTHWFLWDHSNHTSIT